ncbi:MAG: hypothetical protein JSS10_01555 [Verrucomicrobia bacterium]|nr:hypothetical protein [Verrucomicrobiota bacterium]
MAARANRRTYPGHPAVQISPPDSPDPGPHVAIDVLALIIAQGPPRPDATARVNPLPTLKEPELLSQIQKLAHSQLCPDLIKRAELKTQIAQLQSEREKKLSWMTGAYDDLLQASLIAAPYTFNDAIKNTWLGQIQTAYATLNNCSAALVLNLIPLVQVTSAEQPAPLAAPLLVRQLTISKIAGGIVVLLGILLIGGMGIHRLRVMKYIA